MVNILTDADGYVIEWTTASTDNPNMVSVDYDPMELLENDCRLYQYSNGTLTKHAERLDDIERSDKIAEIRSRREVECFPIINRGGLWYDMLSDAKKDELFDWYNAWLEAPETLVIPPRPEWLDKGGDEYVQ